MKSADTSNDPRAVQDLTAEELAILPHYYVMPLELGINDTVAQHMTEKEIEKMHEKSSRWLSGAEPDNYVNEPGRTGFQGGLSWFRVTMNRALQREVDILAGKKIEVSLLVYRHADRSTKRGKQALIVVVESGLRMRVTGFSKNSLRQLLNKSSDFWTKCQRARRQHDH